MYFPFTGNFNDISGNDSFTEMGSLPVFTADRYGNLNSAADFDDSDNLTTSNTITLLGSSADTISISAWIKPDSLIKGPIVSNRPNSIEELGTFTFEYNGSLNERLSYTFWTADNIGQSVIVDDVFTDLSEWYYVSVEHTPLSIIIEVNGVEIANESATAPFQAVSTYPVRIGYSYSEAYYGIIDDVGLSNRRLTASEKETRYKNYHAPGSLIAEASDQQVELKWSSERIAGLQSYQVYRDGSLVQTVNVTGSTDTTYTDTGLTNRTSYQYYITSTDTLGNVSQPSDTVSIAAGNLIAFYPFSGNVADSSGNGNDGSVNGATLTTDRFGNSDAAYSFDGVDDNLQFPAIFSNNLSSGAIGIWSKFDAELDDYNILAKGSDNLRLQYSDIVDDIYFAVESFNGNKDYSDLDLDWTEWVHIFATWGSGSKKLYLNGQQVYDTTIGTRTTPTSGDLYLGRNGAPGTSEIEFLDGSLDDFRFYNNVPNSDFCI